MTTEQKIIRTKVGLLELAKQLGSVSQAEIPRRRHVRHIPIATTGTQH